MVDPGGSWTTYITHTFISADIAGTPFNVSGVIPLSNGNYLFRPRIERGVHISAWGNSVGITILASQPNDMSKWFDGLPLGLVENQDMPVGGVKVWFDGLPMGLTP